MNRHIRGRRRWLRRGGLPDHRALFVRSHPPRHRARVLREAEIQEGRGYRMQIPKEKTLLDLNSLDQRDQTRRPGGGGWLLLGRHARLSRRLRTAGDLRRVVLRRADPKDQLGEIAEAHRCMYHFGEKDPYIPPAGHREDPRRGSERRVSPLPRRSWFQLRRARQLRRRQRAARARTHARSSWPKMAAQLEKK